MREYSWEIEYFWISRTFHSDDNVRSFLIRHTCIWCNISGFGWLLPWCSTHYVRLKLILYEVYLVSLAFYNMSRVNHMIWWVILWRLSRPSTLSKSILIEINRISRFLLDYLKSLILIGRVLLSKRQLSGQLWFYYPEGLLINFGSVPRIS